MASKPFNEPAFPVPMVPWQGGYESSQFQGISLRDWFAGQALAGIIANDAGMQRLAREGIASQPNDTVAGWCYEMADAMLKARETKQE